MQELFANNAIAFLAGSVTSTATTIQLTSGSGSLFPNPIPGSQFFRLSLTDAATKSNHEICYVTARTGSPSADTLTVIRNAEQVPGIAFPGTTGSAWSAGDIASNEVTAGMMINAYSPSNDQANIVRYGIDSGTANAYALAALNPPLPTPTQPAEIIFKPINTNTGPSTISMNGGTAYSIKSPNGSALIGGEIQVNGLVKIVYSTTVGGWIIEWSVNAATLAFNTLTANTPTAANQVAIKSYIDNHPGICKARGSFNGVGGVAVREAYNCTISRVSNGFYLITFPSGLFASGGYSVSFGVGDNTDGQVNTISISNTQNGGPSDPTATQLYIITDINGIGQSDLPWITFAVFGD